MSTIAENLNTLYDIKEGIKEAIEGKGVTVGDASFVDYPQKINDIPQNVDCEEAYNNGYNQGKEDGYAEGNAEGLTAGRALGQDEQKAKLTDLMVTENGVYEAEDGYKSVEVAVPIPTFETSELMVSIESNGHYRYEPSNDGYSLVNVNVSVDASPIMMEFTSGLSDISFKSIKFGSDIIIDCKDIDAPISFSGSTFLNGIGPTILNSSDIDTTDGMFYNCANLKTLPLFDTSRVYTMNQMFMGCESLVEIPLFSTTRCLEMNKMFAYCTSLKTIPQLNLSWVQDMNQMFAFCRKLNNLPLLDMYTAKNVDGMFLYCSGLQNVAGFPYLQVDISFAYSPLTLESAYNIANNAAKVSGKVITFNEYTYNLLDDGVKEIFSNKGWRISKG